MIKLTAGQFAWLPALNETSEEHSVYSQVLGGDIPGQRNNGMFIALYVLRFIVVECAKEEGFKQLARK